ncbi:hypothetical protein ACIXPA_22665 [Bacteroides fragilis]
MEKGKVGEGKIHIIILYRGNLSERGKRRLDAKGRGFAEKGRGKGHFGEEKGCFEEENRGRNWDWERDKLKNRWGIDGSWTGNQTRAERELNEN